MPASVELVKIALKAYGEGDCEIALALSGPDLRWDERDSRPDGEFVSGHDDVARAMRRYLDGWQTYRFELEEVAEAAPGKVVGICRERGVDAEGVPVDRRFGGLWVIEDARITSWSTYLTPRDAVRAAKELAADEAPEAVRSESVPSPDAAPRPDPAPTQVPAPAAEAPPPRVAAVESLPDESGAEPEAMPVASDRLRAAAKARARLKRLKAAS